MTREEKKVELQVIRNLLMLAMEDCIGCRDKLETIGGCAGEAKRLDTIVGKLYDLAVMLHDKAK